MFNRGNGPAWLKQPTGYRSSLIWTQDWVSNQMAFWPSSDYRITMNLKQILKDAYGVVSVPWVIGTSYYTIGFNVLDEDWDVLVVLDACRVVSEYEWLSTPEARWSRGSTSKEEYLSALGYV